MKHRAPSGEADGNLEALLPRGKDGACVTSVIRYPPHNPVSPSCVARRIEAV